MKIPLPHLISCLLLFPLSFQAKAEALGVDSLGSAYGFLLGQQSTLELIERNFPELSNDVKKSWFGFNSSVFGKSQQDIEKKLANQLGEKWPEFENGMKAQLKAALGNEQPTKEQAIAFLAMVDQRAEGEMVPSIRKTLLTVNSRYSRSPALLMADGWKSVFSSRGHEKSKGIKMKISYPITWEAAEGSRPNVMQKFIGKDGTGLDMLILTTRSLPADFSRLSAEDASSILTLDVIKEMMPDETAISNYKLTKLDSLVAGMADFSHITERAGIKIGQKGLVFAVIHDGSLILIQCATGGDATNGWESIDKRFKRMRELYRLIGSSAVFVTQWEEK